MTERGIFTRLEDLPARPVTVGGMEWNRTGTWRYLTPAVQDKTAPCRAVCPAGISIPRFLDAVKSQAAHLI